MSSTVSLIKHSKYIYQYDNFVSKSECDMIGHLVETSNSYLDILNDMIDAKTHVKHNVGIDVTDWAHDDDRLREADNIIHKHFSRCHQKYLSDNKAYYFFLRESHVENLSCNYVYRKYDENDYYDWHVDKTSKGEFVFSYLLYLNDDFEGGDTLFLDDKLRVRPKVGSMLCFPCTPQMAHKGSPVRKGTKRIVWTCMNRTY